MTGCIPTPDNLNNPNNASVEEAARQNNANEEPEEELSDLDEEGSQSDEESEDLPITELVEREKAKQAQRRKKNGKPSVVEELTQVMIESKMNNSDEDDIRELSRPKQGG